MCFAVISTSSYAAPAFCLMLSLTASVMSFHYIFIASVSLPLPEEVRDALALRSTQMEDKGTDLAVSEKKCVPDEKLRKSCQCSVSAKPKNKSDGNNSGAEPAETSVEIVTYCLLLSIMFYHLHHTDMFHIFTAKLEQIN